MFMNLSARSFLYSLKPFRFGSDFKVETKNFLHFPQFHWAGSEPDIPSPVLVLPVPGVFHLDLQFLQLKICTGRFGWLKCFVVIKTEAETFEFSLNANY